MKAILLTVLLSISLVSCRNKAAAEYENAVADTVACKFISGETIPFHTFGSDSNAVLVTMVGHGSLMLEYNKKIIHVDPYSEVAEYSKMPKADIILLTHEHPDHFDLNAINDIRKEGTHFIVSKTCADSLGYGEALINGDKTSCDGIEFEAIAAYNIVHKRPDGNAYHPKGRGNGYVVTIGGKKLYIGADTENIPEMDKWKGQIDVAFLPKNTPYTMTDEMFVDAAKKIMPKTLFPYHFSEYDKEKISKALDGTNIDVVVCPMKNK